MISKNIYKELGGIDVQLILKAAPVENNKQNKKQKASWLKWGAVAACLVFVLFICIIPMLESSDSSGYNSIMALRVYAADGTEQNMELDQSCLKSSISGINAFGKDVPTFEFYVAPVGQGEEGDIFERYDIEISYNGKVVEDKDEHIRLLHVVPGEGIYGMGRYGVIGWFEKATDIIVTLKDNKSSEVVEKMTVNIRYSEADAAYQLTLTDLYSKIEK